MNRVIGWLLLVLAIVTLVGMVVVSDTFWRIYNYVTVLFSVLGGIVLLRQK